MRSSFDLHATGKVALIAFLAAFAFACASTDADRDLSSEENLGPMQGELANAPDWVLRGCSAFWGDEHPAKVCGVGQHGGSRNHALSITAAEGRGRTAIARSLDLRVKAMLKDYQSTTTGGEEFGESANDEQHVVDVSKQITNTTLVGVERRDMWISPSGTVYVLMVMDAEKFTEAVGQMDQLSETVRKAVIERADASFRELDDEIERENN